MNETELRVIVDSTWILLSACLVFFMHAGFALVESGFCRRKNVVMVLMKNLGVISLASIGFFAIGFGFMFGESASVIGRSGFFPAADATVSGAPENLPLYVFLFFQLVFAATAATIVSGAVAERARLLTFFGFTVVATTVIYPVVGHWVWGGGFLASMGFVDFAGSTVVHAVGGAMALAGAIAVGPRLGKYGKGGSKPMPAHNFPLAALGVLVLWLGWFGFTGGSQLAADPEPIASIILVTNLSAAAGFIAALVHTRLRTKMLDLSMALNGALGGLVGITAGCHLIGPGESLIVGTVAGVLVVEAVFFFDRIRVDDPVGAIAVHGVGGIFGTLAVGLFASEGGLFHGGGVELLGIQALGTLTAVAFAFGAGAILWFGMKLLPGGIRVSEEHELEGLDRAECGVDGYGGFLGGSSPGPVDVAPTRVEGATAQVAAATN
ncbi:MAG: ammonium transporter [Myxococcota bacterium]